MRTALMKEKKGRESQDMLVDECKGTDNARLDGHVEASGNCRRRKATSNESDEIRDAVEEEKAETHCGRP